MVAKSVLEGFLIYNLSLIIFGTIGNLTILFVCLRKKMRKVATFQLYAFYTVSELIGLYPWNMTNIINYYFELNLEYTSKFLCHFISYVQYCSFEISSWILVIHKNQGFIKLYIKLLNLTLD